MKNGLIINEYGTKFWYLDDKLNREDGPAIECPNGTKYYYLNDKLTREDGPAVELANGKKYWFLNGENYTEEKYNLIIDKP